MKRLAAVLLMAAACRAGPAPLRLGTTYTVQQSGALAVLESLWTGPAPLTTVVAPSGQILRAAANGAEQDLNRRSDQCAQGRIACADRLDIGTVDTFTHLTATARIP